MQIVYAGEPMPDVVTSSIFLAGPTPRVTPGRPAAPGWRHEAIAILEDLGYRGAVLVPEPRDGFYEDYQGQIDWECEMRERADLIAFWIPRELDAMPAFTTNIEFGEDLWRGRILYGRPDRAPKNRYLDARYTAATHEAPFTGLADLLMAATDLLGPGAERRGGERDVPLHVWKTSAFRKWYAALRDAGNRLDRFKVLRTVQLFGVAASSAPFAWVAHVHVHITAEGRTKTNEVVIGRPDVSSVVPVLRGPDGDEIVLTCEFRSPVRNAEGLVIEPPGGSSPHPGMDARLVAAEELGEELGLTEVDPARLVFVGDRQLAATFLTHAAQVYVLELSEAEGRHLRHLASSGAILGANPEDPTGERIHLRIVPVARLHEHPLDWSSLGLIHQALRVLADT